MLSLRDNKLFSSLMGKYSMFFVLLFMVVLSTFLNSNFLTTANLLNVSRQLAVGTILAFGATLLIIGGMLDLSSGSVLALAGVLSVSFYKATGSLLGSFLVGTSVGVACNLVNAFVVTQFSVPPFIATLSMQTVARGIALLYTKGQNILQLGDFVIFGQGNIYGIPTPIIFLIVITVVVWYILRHTRFGRSLYAIGGNQEAAIAAGINVNREKYKAYAVNGILVGIAGVLFMSRVNAGLPNGAIGFEMEGLTAAIVGGTSFSGGVGTAGGTLIGSFIIGCLNNIMNLTGVDSYVQQITKGAIIALAVIYDIKSKNKKTRKVILLPKGETK
jgi:inositol transport system permease protein